MVAEPHSESLKTHEQCVVDCSHDYQCNVAQQGHSSARPPSWQYSPALGGYFVFKPSSDRIFLQSGQHFARPAGTPAASLESAAYEGPLPPPRNSMSDNNGQRGRQDGRAMRGRGRGRGRSRGRGPSRGRGRGQMPHYDRQSGIQQTFPQPPWTDPRGQPHEAPMPQVDQGLVSGIGGMTLASQAASSETWAQQNSETGVSCGFDPETQVQSLIQKAAPEIVTPPEMLAEGIIARSRLLGTGSGDSEKLDSSFIIRNWRFFCIGRVFRVLWAEPAGANATAITPNTFENVLGERVHAKVRRFVVIREGTRCCCALPIFTYGGQGVAKPGVVKSEHGIIYTGKNVPRPTKAELGTSATEERMRSEPIQVDPDTRLNTLDPMSRINFATVSTVQHNVKVSNVGMVNRGSMRILQQHFQNVWQFSSHAASGSQIRQSQQGPATTAAVYRRAGRSLGVRSPDVVSAGLRGPAAGHGRRELEDSENEVDDEDAEGGAVSTSNDGSDDGEGSEDDES